MVLVNTYEPLMMQQGRLRNARLLLVNVAFTVGDADDNFMAWYDPVELAVLVELM